jgi:hypothetical protein
LLLAIASLPQWCAVACVEGHPHTDSEKRSAVGPTVQRALSAHEPQTFRRGVAETGEPVRVQTFVAQSAVETFNVGILHGLAWLNEL